METSRQHRNTKQRQVILEELRKMPSHPSAATLYQAVRLRLPKISLGTIYRNLDLLARDGVIQKLNAGTSEARYDGITSQHCHVCCVRCGNVEDVHDAPVHVADGNRRTLQGYQVIGHQLQFLGICPDCRKESDLGQN